MITILFFASNPFGTDWLRLDKECREIEENLKKSKHRGQFKFVSKWAVKKSDLLQAINECDPNIIHFSGHGEESEIILEGDDGKKSTISKDAIIRLIGICEKLRLVVFNNCDSFIFAEEIVSKVDFAVGMKGSIEDDTAVVFAYRFYSSLGFGKSVEKAFEQARVEIVLQGFKGADIPQLYTRDGVDKNILFIPQSSLPGLTERLLTLEKSWHGWAYQDQYRDDVQNVKIKLVANIRVDGHVVSGDCTGKFNSPEIFEFEATLEHGSFDGQWLNIMFRNNDSRTFHRGIIILKLSANGNSLEGKYLFNGILKGDIVSGKVLMERYKE
jgi:hypothetical protein